MTAAARRGSNGHRYRSEGYPLPLSGMKTKCPTYHAVSNDSTRRPQRPSGPVLRGFGSREGGTNSVFGGGCQPRRATDVSASETWWSERVRAAWARGRERTSAQQLRAPEGAGGRRGAHTRARGRKRTAVKLTRPQRIFSVTSAITTATALTM